ncbi:MAG: hypothetical protein MZV64_63370 [Ignavibacteriales bacterium]|nr:hypothetical protein [Ignavibacteriales bacterium]
MPKGKFLYDDPVLRQTGRRPGPDDPDRHRRDVLRPPAGRRPDPDGRRAVLRAPTRSSGYPRIVDNLKRGQEDRGRWSPTSTSPPRSSRGLPQGREHGLEHLLRRGPPHRPVRGHDRGHRVLGRGRGRACFRPHPDRGRPRGPDRSSTGLCRLENEATAPLPALRHDVQRAPGPQPAASSRTRSTTCATGTSSPALVKLGDVVPSRTRRSTPPGVERSPRPMPVDYPGTAAPVGPRNPARPRARDRRPVRGRARLSACAEEIRSPAPAPPGPDPGARLHPGQAPGQRPAHRGAWPEPGPVDNGPPRHTIGCDGRRHPDPGPCRSASALGFIPKPRPDPHRASTCAVRGGETFGYLGPERRRQDDDHQVRPRASSSRRRRRSRSSAAVTSTPVPGQLGFLPENPYFYDYLTAREFLAFYARPVRPRPGGPERERIASPPQARRPGAGGRPAAPQVLRGACSSAPAWPRPSSTTPSSSSSTSPWAGIDPLGRKEIRDIIVRFKDEGKTVFFTSHILQDIEMICDRVAIIVGGRIVSEGRLHDLVSEKVLFTEVTVSGVDPAEACAGLGESVSAQRRPGPPQGLRRGPGSTEVLDLVRDRQGRARSPSARGPRPSRTSSSTR